jgi:hypothetical protein
MSDSQLTEAVVSAIAGWLSEPGTKTPPASLERLLVAYSRRFLRHDPHCVCESCWQLLDVDEVLPAGEFLEL